MSDVTDYVSEIEQELIDASNFVPEKKYRKRQDYLAAFIRAISDNVDDETYDKLSDGATDWCEAAVDAYKKAKEIPDFPNGEDHAHVPSVQHEAKEHSPEDDEITEASPDERDEVHDETHEKPATKKKPGRPPGKKNKAKVAKAAKEPKEKKGRVPPRGSNKWGVANNSKSDLVCRMLAQEGGTTMKDIIQATGHAHYNLCGRLARNGHTIIKDGLNLRLINKD